MFLFYKCKLNLSSFCKACFVKKISQQCDVVLLCFAYISKDRLQSAGWGRGATNKEGSDLVSAPNSEIRQAREKFQAHLANTKLIRKHILLQNGLQWALLEKRCCKLKQKYNLIKCSEIQANNKTCCDERTKWNCFFLSIIPLFLIRETKAGNQNVRLFHPQRVPMDTEKGESALILVKIISITSEWKTGSSSHIAHTWMQTSAKTL